MVERPGGEIAKRPLHFIWMLDCSNSMFGKKIESLNNAIRLAIQPMRDAAKTNPEAQVLVRAVTFADDAEWHIPNPTPVEAFEWENISAKGETSLGKALTLVAQALQVPPMQRRALPPVLALVTDGQPTDDWKAGLDNLLNHEWGQGAVRMAIAIGDDTNYRVLQDFASKSNITGKLNVFEADNAAQLAARIEWVSRSVGKSAPLTPETGPAQSLGSDWAPNRSCNYRDEIVDGNANTHRVIRAGITGGVEPRWAEAIGQETPDGTVIWKNLGPLRW
jgi:uncharacterized protein YegL